MDSREPDLLRRFLRYYVPELHIFLLDTLAALVLAAIDLAFPQVLRDLAGGLFTQGPDAIRSTLVYLALGMVGMYALRFLCRWYVSSWGHIMGARMETRMRQDLFDKYEQFSFSYFDHHNTGDLMSRVSNDLFDIAEAAHHGPEWLIICSIEIVGSFVLLALISWQLTLALAATTAVLFAYGLWANKLLADLFRESRRKISQVNSQLEDSLAGARVVKSFANEDVESEKFARSNDAYYASKVRNYQGLGLFSASVSGFAGVLYTIIVVYGPTTVYAGGLIAALRAGAPIHAMAHITGGGITENLDRAMPQHLDAMVERGTRDIPRVIEYMVNAAGLTDDEAYRTFDAGVGMAVICDPDDVDDVAEALVAQGFSPFPMGEVVVGSGKVCYR